MRFLAVAGVILAAAFIMLFVFFGQQTPEPELAETASAEADGVEAPLPEGFVVPELTELAATGQENYRENCIACHGFMATGTENGPPLVHKIYEPSHHGDQAFVLAAKTGALQHHWTFGNMPPVDGITDQEINSIIAYVRQLQRANGIN